MAPRLGLRRFSAAQDPSAGHAVTPLIDPLPSSPVEKPSESPRLTILEHLEELRLRLTVCLIAVVAGTFASFAFAPQLLEWLRKPAGSRLHSLAFFSPTEAFGAYVKLSIACGIALAMPVILFQLWRFVRSGLTWRERFYGTLFVWSGSALFVAGLAFAYWVCLPLFLRFLLAIGAPTLQPVVSIGHYLSFVTGVLLTCGVLFELPLVIVLLTRMGMLMPESLQKHRGAAVLSLLIVAACVTPTTDAVSLLVMTVPLLVLYELSIWLALLTHRSAR